MKILASHFVEDEKDSVSHLQNLSIQLSFYKRKTFKNFDHLNFLRTLKNYNIVVESVHAPAADIYHTHGDEFINMLKKIKKIYNVNIITVHPQRGTKRQAKSNYKAIKDKIEALDIIIAYETFEEKFNEIKWITQIEEMHKYFGALKLPFLGVTYDFVHSEPKKYIKEIKHFYKSIYAIHFSDAFHNKEIYENEKHQHLALGFGDYPVLNFFELLIEINYSGLLILEYLPKYKDYLKDDILMLNNYLKGKKNILLEELELRKKISIT